MILTGYSTRDELEKGMPNFAAVHPSIIDDANMRMQKRDKRGNFPMISEGDNIRNDRMRRHMNQAATMCKAILIIAQKKGITRQIPDDEVGTSDLPQGKLKYDHVPDIANVVGAGGAGRVECTAPFRTGAGMVSNTVMGQEILRSMSDALNRVKKGKIAPNGKKEKLKKADEGETLRPSPAPKITGESKAYLNRNNINIIKPEQIGEGMTRDLGFISPHGTVYRGNNRDSLHGPMAERMLAISEHKDLATSKPTNRDAQDHLLDNHWVRYITYPQHSVLGKKSPLVFGVESKTPAGMTTALNTARKTTQPFSHVVHDSHEGSWEGDFDHYIKHGPRGGRNFGKADESGGMERSIDINKAEGPDLHKFVDTAMKQGHLGLRQPLNTLYNYHYHHATGGRIPPQDLLEAGIPSKSPGDADAIGAGQYLSPAAKSSMKHYAHSMAALNEHHADPNADALDHAKKAAMHATNHIANERSRRFQHALRAGR